MKTVASILFGLCAVSAFAAKRYIFSSWELGDVTPWEILAHADEFDKTGCDGISFCLRSILPGARVLNTCHVMEEPRWTDAELDSLAPVFTELAKHPSMRHSFFGINTAPRKSRLAWDDDAAWRLYADNIAAVARLARKVGIDGILTDFEDYWKKRQFRFADNDPDWETTKRLARQRGREVFGGVFKAYPEIVVLSFQLLTTSTEYSRSADPVAIMEEKRDLWPSFVNGILDVLSPKAKLVDGNESFGYLAKASENAFYRSVRDQLVGVLPLVAEENRAKYRAQLSVSYGLYVDSYSCATNSQWYLGPVRGKRITHIEDNLRQATESADEYVWFWGEKGFWIDWPEDLKTAEWRDVGKRSWSEKYFTGEWGRIKPWNETLDGNFDLLLRGVKNPSLCVREEYARQIGDGSYKNLFTGVLAPLESATNGNVYACVKGLSVDGWYGVKVKGRGEVVRGDVYFQMNGAWRWKLGSVRLDFSEIDCKTRPHNWREGIALVRMPDGASDAFVMLIAGDKEKTRKVEFKDFAMFKIK